jgi:hypothetical protein
VLQPGFLAADIGLIASLGIASQGVENCAWRSSPPAMNSPRSERS